MDKRKQQVDRSDGQLVKRQKIHDDFENVNALTKGTTTNGALVKGINRTSDLAAPIMQLTGHSGEIFVSRFNPSGEYIASGSFDRSILLWNTFGDCSNFGELVGNKGAVLDLQWSGDSKAIYSACTDTHVSTWDIETGQRARRHIGHTEFVNAVAAYRRGTEILASASDDCTVGIWDPRQKYVVDYLIESFAVTSVAFNDGGYQVYSGGLDNEIKVLVWLLDLDLMNV